MTDIRLIATDLDGTLLNREKRMGLYTLETLAECINRGITVMIISGRCHEEARIPAVEAGLPIVVASSNGARIDRTAYGPTIYERLMTREECLPVYEILRDCPGRVNIYKRSLNFVRRPSKIFESGYVRRSGLPDQLMCWLHDDIARMDLEGVSDVYKYEIYDDSPALLADYAARLEHLGLAITTSNPEDIEIQPADSTKGAAVEFMAKHLGITREQTIAFGDNTNDLSMLQAAGIGIAMSNAVDEVKKAADMIAPPCAYEGEARMIRQLVFGEKDCWPGKPW